VARASGANVERHVDVGFFLRWLAVNERSRRCRLVHGGVARTRSASSVMKSGIVHDSHNKTGTGADPR